MLLKDTAEFNHVLFLLYLSTVHNAVLLFIQAGAVLTEKKGSQRLMKDMVEFNLVFFLLYLSIFHNSLLQVVQASPVLTG